MSENRDSSRIEKLKRDLYSRNRKKDGERKRSRLSVDRLDIRRSWDEDKNQNDFFENGFARNDRTEAEENMSKKKKKKSFLAIFLFIAVVFFLASLAIAGYVILSGGVIVSPDNIKINISGPLNVKGGEALELEIAVGNGNDSKIETADLIVEYPEGTLSASNIDSELPRERVSLGEINPGETKRKSIRALVFGQEGETKKIKITLEYRTEDSNAIFFKEEEYDIAISSALVNINVASLKEAVSGNELDFEVEIISNSSTIAENLALKIDYPFGFTLLGAEPSPIYGNNIFKIGSVAPGGKKLIKFSGTLEGQDGEERIFRFFVGTEGESGPESFGTALSSINYGVAITKPFMSLDLSVNGSNKPEYAASFGEDIKVNLVWRNNLPDPISGAELIVKFDGDSLDELSVEADKGFYRSADDTIVWNKSIDDSLDFISPGQSGVFSFRFSSKDQASNNLSNSEIILTASGKARRLSEDEVVEEVKSGAVRSIRFSTKAELDGRIVYSEGPYANSGNIPPKVDQRTTYAVFWGARSSANDISEASVKAVLPPYVSFLESNDPNISFNSAENEVVWQVGGVEKGVASKETSFRIEFLPSASQIGQEPVLVGQSVFSGRDEFTGVIVKSVKKAMTTKISSDPSYSSGDEKVIQ